MWIYFTNFIDWLIIHHFQYDFCVLCTTSVYLTVFEGILLVAWMSTTRHSVHLQWQIEATGAIYLKLELVDRILVQPGNNFQIKSYKDSKAHSTQSISVLWQACCLGLHETTVIYFVKTVQCSKELYENFVLAQSIIILFILWLQTSKRTWDRIRHLVLRLEWLCV